MQIKHAKKLHNRDEVEVKTDEGWIRGYVVGNSNQSKDGKNYWFDIQAENIFISGVHHKDLR